MSVGMTYTRRRARLYEQLESEAELLIDAVREDYPDLSRFARDEYGRITFGENPEWWLECFGATVEEMEELAEKLNRQRMWSLPFSRKRRKLERRIIELDCMVTRGHGLSTSWI